MRVLHLGEHLLDRERVEVDRRPHRHDEHRVLHVVLEELEARQRREQDLLLVRVLAEPREVGAAVDHPHLHLHEHREAAAAAAALVRVEHRLVPLLRRRGEAELDAAAVVVLVLAHHLARQRAPRDAAEDGAGARELAHLDDGGVDEVERRRVQVAVRAARVELRDLLRRLRVGGEAAPLVVEALEALDRLVLRQVALALVPAHAERAHVAEDGVVLDVHRPRVEPRAEHLLKDERRVVVVEQQAVLLLEQLLKVARRERAPRAARLLLGHAPGARAPVPPPCPPPTARARAPPAPPAGVVGQDDLARPLLDGRVLVAERRELLRRRVGHEPVLELGRRARLVVGHREEHRVVGRAAVLVLHRLAQVGARRPDEAVEAAEEGRQVAVGQAAAAVLEELVGAALGDVVLVVLLAQLLARLPQPLREVVRHLRIREQPRHRLVRRHLPEAEDELQVGLVVEARLLGFRREVEVLLGEVLLQRPADHLLEERAQPKRVDPAEEVPVRDRVLAVLVEAHRLLRLTLGDVAGGVLLLLRPAALRDGCLAERLQRHHGGLDRPE